MKTEDIKKLFTQLYLTKRSIETIGRFDSEQSWQRLSARLERRRKIRLFAVVTSSAAAVALFAFVINSLYSTIHYDNSIMFETCSEMIDQKAQLIREDGTTIALSDSKAVIADNIAVDSADGGTLVYSSTKTDSKSKQQLRPVEWQTLSVPRAGEYKLIMADGTAVWLNSDTRLRYPDRFEHKREVWVEGEAYFEVEHDAEHPFIVHVGDRTVEVLGTRFCVTNYPEANFTATLAQGSIRLDSGSKVVVLSPDQQAVVAADNSVLVRQVDADSYTSWINGLYEFSNETLSNIIVNLSRIYDVQIECKNKKIGDMRLAGAISRTEDLGFALSILERVADINFYREADVIMVQKR